MKKFLFGLAPLMAAAMFALAPSTALAEEHHPTGNFAPFKYCPLSNPSIEACIVAVSKSGEFHVGKKTTPITNPITLQGGFKVNPSTGAEEFSGAENGETLSKTPQTVPGGLFGIEAPKSWPKFAQEWFNKFINEGFTGVTETTELAAPASDIKLNSANILFETGVGLQLPVKVKLSNVILGNSCYLGSESNPIILNLTSGTTSPPEPNKPIKGSAGKLEVLESETLLRLIGGSLVDNSFAAPEVTGCGGALSKYVDPLVDSIFGVPSAAGTNTTILSGNLEQAAAFAVKASE